MRCIGQLCGAADVQQLPRASAAGCAEVGDLPLTALIPTLKALRSSLRVAPSRDVANVEGNQQQQQLEELCNLLCAHSNGSVGALVDGRGTNADRCPQEVAEVRNQLRLKELELNEVREQHELAQQQVAAHWQQACGAADDALRMFNEERAKHQLTAEQLSAAREELQAAAHVQVEHRRLETQVNTAEAAQQRMQAELSALQAETTRLAAENKVLKAKTKADVARETEASRVERERSALQSQVARLQAENSGLRAKTERMAAQERELVRIAAGVDLRRQEQQFSFQGMEESSATSRQEDIVVELAAAREALSNREALANEKEAALNAQVKDLEDRLKTQARELNDKVAEAAAVESQLHAEVEELRMELTYHLEAQSTLVTPRCQELPGDSSMVAVPVEDCPGPLWQMSNLITATVKQAAVTAAETAMARGRLNANMADQGYLRKASQLAGDAAAGHAARRATGAAVRGMSEPPPKGPAASAASAAAAAAVAEAAAVAAVKSIQTKPQANVGTQAAPTPLLSASSTSSSRRGGCSAEVPVTMLPGNNGPQVKSSTRSSKVRKQLVSTSASTSATASPQVGTGYATGGVPGFKKVGRSSVGIIDRPGTTTPPAGMFTPRKASPTVLQRQAGGSTGSLQVSRPVDTSSIAPTASSTASPGPTTREPSPRQAGARTPGMESSPGLGSAVTSPGMPRFTPRDISPSSTTTHVVQPQGRTRVPSPNPPPRGGMSPRAGSPTSVPPLPLTTVASRGRLGLNGVPPTTSTLTTVPSGAAPGALPRLPRIAMGSSSSGPLVHRMVSPRGPTAAVGSPTPASGSQAPGASGSPARRGHTPAAGSPAPRGPGAGSPSAPSPPGAIAASGSPGATAAVTMTLPESAGPVLQRFPQSPRRIASPTPSASSPRDGSLPTGSPPSLAVRAYSSGALLPRGHPPEAASPSKD